MATTADYSHGLHELDDGCFAYLQPDGGWGWSNAGLIVGDGQSLLVDTLFDLGLTAAMLDSMTAATSAAPVDTVVNTHANGDHCYGNAEVTRRRPDVDIVASAATAHEMAEVPPSMLAALNQAPGEVGELFRSFFGAFHFDGIELVPPTRTFDGRLDLDVGGRRVELYEVGPAHTAGDTIVYVPDAGTVYTGDILFIGGTPIVWAGPLSNWIAACDLMLGLDAHTVVPGHGPLMNVEDVARMHVRMVKLYAGIQAGYKAGLTDSEIRKQLDLSEWRPLHRFAEQMGGNINRAYLEIEAAVGHCP